MKYWTSIAAIVALHLFALAGSAFAQANNSFDSDDGFGLPEFPVGPGADQGGKELKLSGEFKLKQGTQQGVLSVTATPAPNWYTYSMSQNQDSLPSELTVAPSDQFQVDAKQWEADRDPHLVKDDTGTYEKFEQPVTWSAPITLAVGVDPAKLQIQVTFNGQVCEVNGPCLQLNNIDVPVTFAGYYEETSASGEYRAPDSHVTIRGRVEPKVAAPGSKVSLTLTAIPDQEGNWHVYALADKDPDKISKPTLIALTKLSGLIAEKPAASATPHEEESGLDDEPVLYYHEEPVDWTIELTVPEDAEPGEHVLSGIIGYQACTDATCDLPTAAKFTAEITVAANSVAGTNPVEFSGPVEYGLAAKEAAQMTWGAGSPSASAELPVTMLVITAAVALVFLAVFVLAGGVKGFQGLYANLHGIALLLVTGLVLAVLHNLDKALTEATLWTVLAVALAAWMIAHVSADASVVRKIVTIAAALGIVAIVAAAFFIGKDAVPACALIAGGGLAVFAIMKIPSGANVRRKVAGFTGAVIALLLSGGIAAFAMQSTELDWEPFSKDTLNEYRKQGHIVLIDFTADW